MQAYKCLNPKGWKYFYLKKAANILMEKET